LPDDVAGRLKRKLNFSNFRFRTLEVDFVLGHYPRIRSTSSFKLMSVTTAQLYSFTNYVSRSALAAGSAGQLDVVRASLKK